MALGLRTEGIYNIAEIPLDWENKELVANHLRMLADYIQEVDISIQSVGVIAPICGNLDKPHLEIRGFIKDNR